MRKWRGVILLVTVVAIAACSSTSLEAAGYACSADTDCAAGLVCLGLGKTVGGTCMMVEKACSKACKLNSDCEAVGANFKCFPSCGGLSACYEARTDAALD